jgi:hypothetical protein
MSEHIVQPRIYIAIFLALMVGTALTLLAAFYDFPGRSMRSSLTIAVIKATRGPLFHARSLQWQAGLAGDRSGAFVAGDYVRNHFQRLLTRAWQSKLPF